MLNPFQLERQAAARVVQLRRQAEAERSAPVVDLTAGAARWLHTVADRLEPLPSPGRAIARERGVAP